MTKDGGPALLEEIGEGALYIGGSGQGLSWLQADPIARRNAPSAKHCVDTAHISRYNNTDFFQWHGRKADGYFHPIGKIMRLTDAGRADLAERHRAQEERT